MEHKGDMTATGSGPATVVMIAISALLCLGALMVYSAGASVDQQIEWRHFWKYASVRRVAMVPVVWVILALFSHINYRRLVINEKRPTLSPILWLVILSAVSLVLALIPGIGTPKNNSWRWIEFGPVSFQPSELAKWSMAMFLPVYCWWRKDKLRSFWKGFLPSCAILVVVAGLIGKEDFGTAILVSAVGIAVLLMGGVRWWHLLVWIPLLAAAFYVLIFNVDYRWRRVQAYLYGDQTGQHSASTYHANQSIMAVGAGGVWGAGLGKGTIKLGWVPEDTTDFVFAIIGEELGLVGCGMVIGLYALLMVASLRIIHRARDSLEQMVAAGISLTIGAQAAMNLMVVTGLAPTKGIALPFVSAGGTGLLISAAAAGILVNIGLSQGLPLKSAVGEVKASS